MKANESSHAPIIELFNNCDLAYSFKNKRLRYLRSASVHREMLNLRDNFNTIWQRKGDLYHLKDADLSVQGRDILQGLFGDADSAQAILKINKGFADLDRRQITDFFRMHISSRGAQKNLTAILFEGDDSLVNLARKQIPYFEQYMPTMKKFSEIDVATLSLSQRDLDNILHFLSRFDIIQQNLSIDVLRYKEFGRDFFRLYRESATIDVVGYGEISTVMQLNKKRHVRPDIVGSESKWIWKKMPPFPGRDDVDRYLKLYDDYRNILTEGIGIAVPMQIARFFRHDDYYQVYAGQERVKAESIGNVIIKILDESNAIRLLQMILKKLCDVHMFNLKSETMKIGIDAQLSNWALVMKNRTKAEVGGDEEILYIDTSSPMMRINGTEQLNPEIFIKSAASFLRPVIRRFFLQQVLDRYYDMRAVAIDVIANLHKEKRADLINSFIETTNEYFAGKNINAAEITRKEIDAYYSNDAFIWKFYQASRKIDRFLTEKIARKRYMFRIPEKIER
ncbi:MAG TPA: DUF6206 family protein [Spirochaetota bacterium]|nr:DUF6206 family protein [Spirochaetota bacterium]